MAHPPRETELNKAPALRISHIVYGRLNEHPEGRGRVSYLLDPDGLGADATFTNSDDITATLLDQPITFRTSSQDTTLRGFAGIDLVQAMDNGADLKLSVEAGYDTGHAVTLKATAGLAWAF